MRTFALLLLFIGLLGCGPEVKHPELKYRLEVQANALGDTVYGIQHWNIWGYSWPDFEYGGWSWQNWPEREIQRKLYHNRKEAEAVIYKLDESDRLAPLKEYHLVEIK
jgi:hypothetical protein